MERFAHAASPNFDPARDLRRIGVANQTTMLARESLAIGELVGQSMARAHGAEYAKENFRTFDTICSATQERQDAVVELLREPLDVMVVIGGYNSSNTMSLAALCSETVRTFHVEDAARHRPRRGEHSPPAPRSEGRSRVIRVAAVGRTGPGWGNRRRQYAEQQDRRGRWPNFRY